MGVIIGLAVLFITLVFMYTMLRHELEQTKLEIARTNLCGDLKVEKELKKKVAAND